MMRGKKVSSSVSILNSTLSPFQLKNVEIQVLLGITIQTFMEACFDTLKYYNPWTNQQAVKEAIYFYFQKLIHLQFTDPDRFIRRMESIVGSEEVPSTLDE